MLFKVRFTRFFTRVSEQGSVRYCLQLYRLGGCFLPPLSRNGVVQK